MNNHHFYRLFAVVALAATLSACDREQKNATPATVFNQKLTDVARLVSNLPAGVELIQCWPEKSLVSPDRAFCNIFLRGSASKDIGQKAIGWDIPVREPRYFDGIDGEKPRYLESYQFNLPLLADTGFLFVAKNDPQGLRIEIAANQDRLPFNEAQSFISSVLPVVSGEMSKQLEEARTNEADSIRATWASK